MMWCMDWLSTKNHARSVLIVYLAAAVLGILGLGAYASVPIGGENITISGAQEGFIKLAAQDRKSPPAPVAHVPSPEEVRGIYWTARTAGIKRADELLEYMGKSGLNTAVIDLKIDNGALGFEPRSNLLKPYAYEKSIIADLDGLLKRLGQRGIYRIARIAVMRDSTFARIHPDLTLKYSGGALWRDNTGAAWIDPAAPEVSDYALTLGREAYSRGFDEVQFDYVRFPSDGALGAIVYPLFDENETTKVAVMQEFWKKVGGTLQAEDIPVSFDLFGMTFWSAYDYHIGQRLADAYLYADYISPMAYPSHYASGVYGYKNPALYPYEIVKDTLDKGVATMASQMEIVPEEARRKFRPWLQDFDLGAVYTAQYIEAQIKAARDAGASGWLLWNARNIYEPAQYVSGASRE